MGTTLLALQIYSSFQKCLHYWSLSQRCILRNVKWFLVLAAKLTTSPVLDIYEISTVKECSHIANAHLKIIRYDLKAFFEDKKKTPVCLQQSTLGICICTSISWQCKLLSKELWICFANERIPINPWNLIVHGLYFFATTFFQSGIHESLTLIDIISPVTYTVRKNSLVSL